VTGIAPTFGPSLGGTTVTVTGSDFLTSSMLCRFGIGITSATTLSTSTLRCLAPARNIADVALEVSNDQISYSASGVLFGYVEAMDVTTLVPSAGPSTGATIVTVTGSAFTVATSCRFGTAVGGATTVDSSTRVRCTSPAHAAGAVALEVTGNGVDLTLASRMFEFYSTRSPEFFCCIMHLTRVLQLRQPLHLPGLSRALSAERPPSLWWAVTFCRGRRWPVALTPRSCWLCSDQRLC
jgi:hypothetical protein